MKRRWFLYGIAVVMVLGWLMVMTESPGPGYRQFLTAFGLPVAGILLLGWYLSGRSPGRQHWRDRRPSSPGSPTSPPTDAPR
jgi:hypothetical protein